MNEVMTVENTEMQIREYNGQRVVTFKDIDRVHENKTGTARRNFNRNRKHFIEGVDFFILTKGISNETNSYIRNISVPNKGITVLTETGYLMIVKSLSGELSWSVQRQLVNNYFENRNDNIISPNKIRLLNKLMLEKEDDRPKAPLNPDWYDRNANRIYRISRMVGVEGNDIFQILVSRLTEKYDMQKAKEIYKKNIGKSPENVADVIGYFPEMGDMADRLLDRMEWNVYGR